MGNVLTSAPTFTQRVPLQFFCPDSTSLNVTGTTALQNNPSKIMINTGTNAKVDLDINGSNHYRGDGEFPPFSIELTWDVLGYNDYLKLAALRPYYVHFVTHRNLGYYGKLVCSGPNSAKTASADTVSLKAQFFPLTPSDYGGAQTVNRIATPTALTVSGPPATPAAPTVTVTGTAGTTSYTYKVIARSANGDSLQSTGTTVTTGNATLNGTNYNAVSWAAVSGATSYIVLRGGLQIYSGSAISVNDTGLATTTYAQSVAGYIGSGLTTYYWITFSSQYGETVPYGATGVSSGVGTSRNAISWAWPSTTAYCIAANLYAANTNDPTQSKLVASIPNGLNATWTDYVGPAGLTVSQQPPVSSTAYRGAWRAGIWWNESP